MSVRVCRARAVVAHRRQPTVAARVAGISRQAIYRPVSTRPPGAGPGKGRPGDDHAIVEVARANPTDVTRMVAALASQELGVAVNRKRAQRVMRARYYDPQTAQFLTRDPLVGQTRSPYGYADNDPINNSDPSGLYCLTGKNPNGSCRSVTRGAAGKADDAWDATGGRVVSYVADMCVDINSPNCESYAEQHPALQSGLVVVADASAVVACTAASFGTCGAALLLATEGGMLRDASRGGGLAAIRNDCLTGYFSYIVSAAANLAEMPFLGSLLFGAKTAAGGSSGDIQIFLKDLGVIG